MSGFILGVRHKQVSGVSVQVSVNIKLKSENNQSLRSLLLFSYKSPKLATEGLTPDT